MKLRSQLFLAFLVLAVLPLAGIVGYSYLSSARAFRAAVEAENVEVTRQISIGLDRTRSDLRRYVNALGGMFPFDDPQYVDRSALVEQLLGDDADFVEMLEYVPSGPGGGAPGPPGAGPGADRPGRDARRFIWSRIGDGDEDDGDDQDDEGGRRFDADDERRRPRDLARLFGRPVTAPVHRNGQEVGQLQAEVSTEAVMRHVLRRTPRAGGAVPFAVDGDGTPYASETGDIELLLGLECPDGRPLLAAITAGDACEALSDWVVATRAAPSSDLVYGIVRPIGASLAEMRSASLRNFGVGIGLMSLSLVAAAPLANRLTRRLSHLTRQVDRLARGDAAARARLGARDEVGKLGEAFNRMARDQEKNRQQLIEQERHRRQQAIDRRLLEAENERQTLELEEARKFQLSLLPAALPEHPDLEIGVFLCTASEVGGDYYDFSPPMGDGSLTIAVGDATGHGARAGTMVTVVKTLLASSSPGPDLAGFLSRSTASIRSMNLGRRAMAVVLARYRDGVMEISSAGMPPVLISRCPGGEVEEIMTTGVPLGTLAVATYEQRRVRLDPGDSALLLSDGLPEMLDDTGEPVGYPAVAERWGAIGQLPAAAAVADLEGWFRDLSSGGAPPDDVTFVVIRRRPSPA